MKKILPVLLVSFFLCEVLNSQDTENGGKPVAEIFTDFHYNFNDTSKTTGFGIERVRLGYNINAAKNISAMIVVNISNADDYLIESHNHRNLYFKYAFISWSKNKLKLSLGITGTHLSDYQQKFWQKRYIANTFVSLNGYGYNSDLGFVLDYSFNDIWKAHIAIINGEGYSDLQLDNSVKTSVGLTINPSKHLALKLYGDITRPSGILQYMMLGFAGFKNDLITIGAELSYKSNLDLVQGHHAWGISTTGSISISKNEEIFVRYDYSTSVTAPYEMVQWNYLLDGRFLIAGL